MTVAYRDSHAANPADLLVIGLGNPGKEYAGTRHNVGVEVIHELARRHGGTLKDSRCKALVAEVRIDGRLVVLAFPLTYMNLSGEAAALLARRYSIEDPTTIVVVHDELDLPPGTLKVKAGGGLAGNNGLRSLKQHLGTDAFLRVRIGIGKPPSKEQGANHVLRKPTKAEREVLDIEVQRGADAVELILRDGIAVAMNRMNTPPPSDGGPVA